ncbi:Universal stress protein [Nonomuraea coxensis DSM 45129]|uniref:Universal stress protein n=1 Tax=Nonomuraea coxensis DSM 45129 TaxID=1122611 RepID=A0ABX8TZW5_9ACTN|nr:universal stress protein [Nonomuraea coxensis]QYC40924.1 Universal stress protein [Nonomuraea coxensis DSM 45129]
MTGQIVVGVDGSAAAGAAVDWAAAEARTRNLRLRVVHACERGRPEHEMGCCASTLAFAGDRARALAGGQPVTTELLAGNVVDRLLAEAATADSLVLGSRGLGELAALLIGSVSLAVAGHASGPVVVVRGPGDVRHGRVVAGYDGSAHAEAAMEYAVAHARAHRSRLHVVHVWRTPAVSPYAVAGDGVIMDLYQEDTRAVADGVDRWRERNPDVEITHEAWIGHPASVLAEAAASADLVVVGSRGLGGLASAIMGSVGHGVLHHVTCPVAVVRPRAGTP